MALVLFGFSMLVWVGLVGLCCVWCVFFAGLSIFVVFLYFSCSDCVFWVLGCVFLYGVFLFDVIVDVASLGCIVYLGMLWFAHIFGNHIVFQHQKYSILRNSPIKKQSLYTNTSLNTKSVLTLLNTESYLTFRISYLYRMNVFKCLNCSLIY